MSDAKVSIVDNPSSRVGDSRPKIDPDFLSSVRALPAKARLEGAPISIEDLFSRSFILKDQQFNRLLDHETLTLEGVELAQIQDHSTKEDAMDTVFVFRVFPKSLVDAIKKKAAERDGYVRKKDLRSLSLFEAIKINWEDSSSMPRSYHDSVRSGQQTVASLKHKEVNGEDRLFVGGFMPTLSEQQIDDRYARLDDEAMRLLREGEVLRVEEAELADRRSWTDSDGDRKLAFIFRVMPDETRQLLLSNSMRGPIRWVDRQPSKPLNAVLTISESQCPSHLLNLQTGQEVEVTMEHENTDDTSVIVVRSAEALEKPQCSTSSSEPTEIEEPQGHSSPPRPRPSTNPNTSSPQYNDEWYEIDGHRIHRDQL